MIGYKTRLPNNLRLNLNLKVVETWDDKIFFPYTHASKTLQNECCTNKPKNKHGDECEHSTSLCMNVFS
jgi:hypothetical protein